MRDRLRPYAVLFAAWAAFRTIEQQLLGPGFGSDPSLYLSYAKTWCAGAAPYADFHPEYPPAALLIFVVPFLAAGLGSGYVTMFQLEMAVFDFATVAAVFAFATHLWPKNPARQIAATAGYLVATAVLHPVLYWRFDLVPAALTLGAVYLAATRREIAGAALLGLGGSFKLWPLALAPLWLGWSVQRHGWRGALREALSMAAGLALPVAVFVVRARTGIFGFLQFQSERALQIESFWANLALLADALGLARSRITYNHGAFNVEGSFAATLKAAAHVVVLVLTLAPQAVVDNPGHGTGERLGQHLQHKRKAQQLRSAGELQQHGVQSDHVKPVAHLADDLRDPQAAEVGVAAQQLHIGRKRDGLRGHDSRVPWSNVASSSLAAMIRFSAVEQDLPGEGGEILIFAVAVHWLRRKDIKPLDFEELSAIIS